MGVQESFQRQVAAGLRDLSERVRLGLVASDTCKFIVLDGSGGEVEVTVSPCMLLEHEGDGKVHSWTVSELVPLCDHLQGGGKRVRGVFEGKPSMVCAVCGDLYIALYAEGGEES